MIIKLVESQKGTEPWKQVVVKLVEFKKKPLNKIQEKKPDNFIWLLKKQFCTFT